jgi:hypothetical protein
MFLSAGCSLLRAEDSIVKVFNFWSSNPCIRIRIWNRILILIDLKYWIRTRIETSADLQHCLTL